MKVNVLGTIYDVRESNRFEDASLGEHDGYCDTSVKHCIVDEMSETGVGAKKNLPEYKKQVTRHELIHAFLFEAGLDVCSWAQNEEIVDWIAIMFPRMLQAFDEADCI